MAKGLLRFFGVVSVFVGFCAIGFSFVSGAGMFALLPWGVAMLLAGAPLLGFAYGLELLEDIARNTAPRP